MFGEDFWKIVAIIKFIIEILMQVKVQDLDGLTASLKQARKNGNQEA